MSERSTLSKETIKLIVNSAPSLTECITKISGMFVAHKHLTISIRPGKDRSLAQNNLSFEMYKRVASVLDGESIDEVRADCKLMLGVPILERDVEGYAAEFKKLIGNFTYEGQIYLMGANKVFGKYGYPVTSLFGTKQFNEYIEKIADHYAPQHVYFEDILKGEIK